MKIRMILLAATILCSAHVVSAADGIPVDYSLEYGFVNASLSQVTIFANPAGTSGFGLDHCFDTGTGNIVDGTLKVRILRNNEPMLGLVPQQVRLSFREISGGTEVPRTCGGQFFNPILIADEDGYVTIPASQINGFGAPLGGAYQWHFCVDVDPSGNGAWKRAGSGTSVNLVTADLSGDGIVNMADVYRFASLYNTTEYDMEIDFNSNGLEDVGDVNHLSASIGMECGAKVAGEGLSFDEILDIVNGAVSEEQTTWSSLKSSFR